MPTGIYKHKPRSEETKRKIGEAHKSKKLSEEHKNKLKVPHIGSGIYVRTKETRQNISKSRKGKKLLEETKSKIGKTLKGRKKSEETKIKIKNALKGHFVSEETKRKLSESNIGSKSSLWKGGKSFEPYTTDWTKTLKKSIRERDHYICQLCSSSQGDINFSVHHIDYNKSNCNPNNLITLCKSCHIKTNNHRKFWTRYFNKRV